MKSDKRQIELFTSDSNSEYSSLSQKLLGKKMSVNVQNRTNQVTDTSPTFAISSSKNEEGTEKEEKKKEEEPGKKAFSWPIWKKLFQYSMKRKYHLFLGLLLNILFAVAISLLPMKVGEVLDLITKNSISQDSNNKQNLRKSILQLAIMTIFLAFFTYTRYISLQFLQEYLAMDMRNDFYKKFIGNDMYFFQQYKSGELVSRLSSDVKMAKSAVSNNLTLLIRNFCIILGSFVVLFIINIKLTLLVMLLVPLYLIITIHYSRRSKLLVRQAQDNQAKVSAEVAQKFSGVQLVKAYSNEDNQIQRYQFLLYRGFEISKKKIFLKGLYNSCSEFLPYLGIMMVLWYGGLMVLEGNEITAGQLTAFILYCRSLSSSTSAIANSYTNIINGTYAVQKVFQMMEYQPLVDESVGQNHQITGSIQFNKVHFNYPLCNTVALNGISFNIKKGQYVAFVGESGSGKSTIVKLIQKFYKIQAGGSINFGPHSQDTINAVYLRKQIGLVNQDATMFSGTIRDNIIYGIGNYADGDIENAAQRAGCMEFLSNSKRFPQKFFSQVGEKGHNLSGGQRQRISIARALMRNPKLIIFDEATSALDSNSERMVQQSIQSLAQSKNGHQPTIIVIAHRLSTVIKADRIFVMKNGEIQEVGTHSELLEKRGYYYQLIEKQLSDSPQNLSPTKTQPN